MRILITGSSSGIGKAVALKFLSKGFEVHGIDILPSSIENPSYFHHQGNVVDMDLPRLDHLDVLFLNAGVQNSGKDIDINLKGSMRVAEFYQDCQGLSSILFNASASARNGYEFPEYVASKAGLVGYMKNLACRLAKKGVTVNSLSLGGVLTSSNDLVINDPDSWKKIMDVTPLKKWASLEEVAEWVYFLTVINRSMSGQDLLIDNGENDLNCTFVWPNK